MPSFDTVIIGAGVTGLSAAYHLTQRGQRVLIIEKDNEPGGLLASHHVHGYKIEKFYHHILPGEEIIVQFLNELKIQDKLIWLPASVGYLLNKTVYKLDTPFDILRFPALNLWDKIRLALTVDNARNIKDTSPYDNRPAKDWLIQHAGERVFHNFFEPLLHGKFGNDIDNISAAWMIERIKIRSSRSPISGEKLGYLDGGFSILVDTLCQKIREHRGEIQTKTGVDELVIENNTCAGVRVGKEIISSKSVINTTSPQLLITLARNALPDTYRERMNQIRYQHTLCILLGLDRRITDTYWLNIANSKLPFAVMLEHTNFYNRIYGGEHIVYLASYIQEMDNPIWQKTDKEIFEKYFNSLMEIFDISSDNILWWRLGRGYFTSPVYGCGYLSRMLPLTTPIKNLYMAGMMHSYPERSINDSVRQGVRCARLAMGEFTVNHHLDV